MNEVFLRINEICMQIMYRLNVNYYFVAYKLMYAWWKVFLCPNNGLTGNILQIIHVFRASQGFDIIMSKNKDIFTICLF